MDFKSMICIFYLLLAFYLSTSTSLSFSCVTNTTYPSGLLADCRIFCFELPSGPAPAPPWGELWVNLGVSTKWPSLSSWRSSIELVSTLFTVLPETPMSAPFLRFFFDLAPEWVCVLGGFELPPVEAVITVTFCFFYYYFGLFSNKAAF